MKRVKFKIDTKGNYEIDMGEGFQGMTCEQKAEQMQIIIGGIEKDSERKPEYYEGNDDLLNDLDLTR